ncbi:PAS domain S-box protein [Silvibacterium dinghuense]|uniref:PAS domain S-box protein n=1 Tax=Silvibacterium dinghuense TaxID=1560006 RepID=UPI00227AFB8A|nr:PAS domain S-box protein [Silvibacterium dinghuense]
MFVAAALASFRAARHQRESEGQLQQISQLQQSILDSAGPMIMATDLDGMILIFNPAAERMLGYTESEVCLRLNIEELFLDGELERVGRRIASRPQLPALQRGASAALPESLMARFIHYVSGSPASRVRGIEMQYRRKDGSTFPAMVYLGAVRSATAQVTGLVCVSMDLSSTKRAEQALRESEDRYRDLFDNSQEMIATLSPRGRYLYVNPAWQALFGINSEGFQSFISFESPFPVVAQAEAAALFRRALKGENVEGELLKLLDTEGRPVEAAASLSCRYSEGRPVAVRCIFRDVTQQNLRERRLRMQLQINQMIGESTTAEEAFPKVLGALCASLSCDLANLWVVDESSDLIRFQFGWSTPGHIYDEFQRETRFRVFSRGQGLPGIVWNAGAPRWIEELRDERAFERRFAARIEGLQTGWAVPVRAVNQVIAVVEFFSRQRQREDAETMASVETVCASLGQFMARFSQERRVQELNRQKEFILNSVADGIFGINSENGVDFVNPAAAEMLSADTEDLAGQPLHALLHQEGNCNQTCVLQRALHIHEASSGQDVFYRADGSNFPVEFALTPMIERGVVVGSVLSFRDISQRYALDRMKDEFISTVSHELRTPLTSIRGALGLLSHGLLNEVNDKAANLLRIAVSNSDRLVRLINDILDLERMQSGRAPLALRPCAVHELARQVADSMQPVADSAGVTLSVEAEPISIEADPDRLNQVLTNLLSNAIKFSSRNSRVRIVVGSASEGLALSVIDEGRGIPADKLESIFDRFHQVDASDSRQKGGTGLGLAICRTIVEQHGGRIWAEQNSGTGSTFRIVLPAALADSGPALMHPAPASSEAVTLLICEPDAEVRRTIAEPLRRHRYRIYEAENREQTMQLAHRFPLSAILLGLSHQPHNGFETMEALKSDAETATIPIVVLSLLSLTDKPLAARTADSWLQRPVEEASLLAELRRVLKNTQNSTSVLLVEDDEDLAKVMTTTLERAGFSIRHAATVGRAIALCEQSAPDLIILDLALPDGHGLELVRWLRLHPLMRRLPLVVYSAREVPAEEQTELRLGQTEFLTKAKVQPQEVEELVVAMLHDSGRDAMTMELPFSNETAETAEQ